MTILEKAIDTYGKDMQLNVAIEELSELTKICKNKRGADNIDNIIEEMADCYIMLAQLAIIFNIERSELDARMNRKLNRLKKRLAEKNVKEMCWREHNDNT